MNGTTERDYGGRTVYENAERMAQDVIERAVRHEGRREPNPEWDVRSEVYAREVGRVEQYLIAGNGPTGWLVFVLDSDDTLGHAYLRYVSAGDAALVHLGQFDGEDLYKAVREYR